MTAKPTGAVAPIHASRARPAFFDSHPGTAYAVALDPSGAKDEGRAA